MADSVVRLTVNSSEYDQKLKQATQGLTRYADQCRKVGGTLEVVEKETLDYVRAIGQMDTTSRTATGKLAEMKKAFVELSAQYKQMTDAEKASPFGKALSESLNELKPRIMEAKQQLDDINKSMIGASSSSGGGLFAGLGDKMSGALQVFAGNMMTKSAGAVASLGSEMAGMVQQGIELARQGEGIRMAFERLGRGDILDGLREATHGTVTDLELMKAAVKFNDFKLPVEELGILLQFAQQKAKDTGQSVDYMVDSIVTGLGRKSLMILDNLGLSANEVKEKMKETGDMTKAVGEIIREQMAKAGDYVETAADRAAQANVSLQNKMEELGRKFAPLQEASSNFWTSMKIGILDVIGGPLTNLLNKLTEAGRLANQYGILGGKAKVGRMTSNLSNAREDRRQGVYQQQVAEMNRYINRRENYMKDRQRWVNNQGNEDLRQHLLSEQKAFGTNNVGDIQNQINAAKQMLAEYQQSAKQILQPITQEIVPTVVGTTGGGGGKGGGGRSGGGKTEPTYAADSIAAQQRLVADLERQWNEAGADVHNQYVKPLVEAEAKLKQMKDEQTLLKEQAQGKLLGDTKTTTITAKVDIDDNEALERLRDIDGITIDPKTLSVTADTQEALEKLRDIDGITIDPKTLSVTADTQEALERLRDIDGITIDPKTLSVTADTQEALEKLRDLRGVHLDESTIQTNTETQGIEIPISSDVAFDEWMDGVKEKLENIKIDPIKIPIEASKKDVKAIAEAARTTADVVGSIGDAFNSIEDPAAKVMGTVMQAIASVALGYAQATAQAGSMGPWVWLAFAASGLATMIATISTIHSQTGYAEGGMIKGNSYSGDRIGGLVDGSQLVGLNAGEVVLNAAQQNTLAQNLEGAGLQNLRLEGVVTGENIKIALNRHLRRIGEGEIVTW